MQQPKNATLLKIAGVFGILTPVIAFACIFLAIACYPQFSWTNNALSDLGIVPGATSAFFNSGLIISGVCCLLFVAGLFKFMGKTLLSRVGVFVFVLACLALVAIGIFPENVKPTHYIVSVMFFVLLPISLLIVTGAFWLMRKVRMAVFTLLVAVAAAAPWVLLFSLRYVTGVAIPEFASAVAGAVWAVTLSCRMIIEASRSKTP